VCEQRVRLVQSEFQSQKALLGLLPSGRQVLLLVPKPAAQSSLRNTKSFSSAVSTKLQVGLTHIFTAEKSWIFMLFIWVMNMESVYLTSEPSL